MDSLINTLIITGIVVVVIFFIIACSINIAARQNKEKEIDTNDAL